MTDDRRKPGRIPAWLEVMWEGITGRHEARTSDITTAGCFVDTIGQVTVGEIVNFKIQLPAEDLLELRGEVIYAYPSIGFGLQFTDMSDADRKRLEWLVKAEAFRRKDRTK